MNSSPKIAVFFDPRNVSPFKKQRYIKSLSEDEFRDKIVRRLFLNKGLTDGRDLCGPEEQGRDCLFRGRNHALETDELYYIQTKKGNVNFSSDTSRNIITIITQLETALCTPYFFTAERKEYYPNYVMLVASGNINDKAKAHIKDKINDSRLLFYGLDDLIAMIDESCPELWYGIDAEKVPYLKKLFEELNDYCEIRALSEYVSKEVLSSATSDDVYIQLHVHRYIMKPEKGFRKASKKKQQKKKGEKGSNVGVPEIEEFPIQGLLKRRESLVLLVGEAGSGKSTSLRRIAVETAKKALEDEKDLTIPVYIRATNLINIETTFLNTLANETVKLTNTGKPGFTDDDLIKGKVIFLIDGLDEIFDVEKRKTIVNEILLLNNKYPDCKIFLTSREYSFLNDIKGIGHFVKYTLSPISFNQTKKLVAKLRSGKSLPEKNIQEILRKIESVHGIDLNPLLVTVFVATSDYSRNEIPANITELFKKYTELMLGRWDANKGLGQQQQAPIKDHLLKKLAFSMHQSKTTRLDISKCKNFLKSELDDIGYSLDIDELVNEIIFRSGLIRLYGSEIEFRHMIIQEFFAGRGIPSKNYIDDIIHDERWRTPIVFYFGEKPDNYEALKSVIDNSDKLDYEGLFEATIVAGLSLQASYLMRVSEKYEVLKWVTRIVRLQITITKTSIH